MVKQTGSMQGMLHEAEAARATAAREAASSSAEATSARQEAASAMEAARRAEWKATELGVKVRSASYLRTMGPHHDPWDPTMTPHPYC